MDLRDADRRRGEDRRPDRVLHREGRHRGGPVTELTDAFVAELDAILGPRFVGLILYGAAMFPPSPVSDYDGHVLVSDPFTDEDRGAIHAMQSRLHELPLGDDMDVWYVTLDEASGSEPPQTQLRPGFRDDSWALHRAHWHAGRCAVVKGPDPRTIVPAPRWDEIDEGLQGELSSVENHLDDAPAFSVLNLCRILYSYETTDAVVGKFQAAMWALAFLDVDRHALIRGALEAYRLKTYAIDEDVRPFFEEMRERIARARLLV